MIDQLAFGAGPVITGVIPCGKHEIDFHVRRVHEFENRNRVEGNLYMLSGTMKF